MHNGYKSLLLILLQYLCCLSSQVLTRKKEIVFAPHSNYKTDSLLWTVQIKHNISHLIPLPVHSHDHGDDVYTIGNYFAGNEIETQNDRALVHQVASDCNLVFLGHVGELKHIYLLGHPSVNYTLGYLESSGSINPSKLKRNIAEENESKLDNHPNVLWFHREKVFSRGKRSVHFNDPVYPQQWHLKNHVNTRQGMDINVTGVWEYNITGAGVTVSVVDDGLEWTSPDISENYNAEGSIDLNSNDDNPMPNDLKESNHHGTRCAGEIAAVANSYCAVGVAYNAKVSGIRILDGPMTDSLEAKGFNAKLQINDIYSCSWGPDDDGKTVDGPHFLAAKAIRYGIDFGRSGYGSIYVVASGNGGRFHDNCNYDGYANSIYTVTIGAVDETGKMPFYAEECASMLAVTFSSGTVTRSIVTTDWTKHGATGCTNQHTGTSAAAPLAAGMIALMLEARPCLTWRDVQYIIIMTAQKVDIDVAHWQKNKAGLYHSHKHGFGLMKAWRLVNAARVWEAVPWLTSYLHSTGDINIKILKGVGKPLIIKYTVTKEEIEGYDLFTLENSQLAVTLTHPRRGDIQIALVCPSGTRSIMGAYRIYDRSSAGLVDWTFNTVRCWGESPIGQWRIEITDKGSKVFTNGYLKKWKLRLFGTAMSPGMFLERRRLVEEAMSGEYLNSSYNPPCWVPPNTAKPDTAMNEKTLKILTLASAFCVVLGIYQTLEYILCYNEEKKLVSRMRKVHARAQQLSGTSNDPSETTGLLSSSAADTSGNNESWEEIPMQDFTGRSPSGSEENSSESDQPFGLRVALPPQVVHTDGYSCSHQGGQSNMELDSLSRPYNSTRGDIIEHNIHEIQKTDKQYTSNSNSAIDNSQLTIVPAKQGLQSGTIIHSIDESSDVDDVIFNRQSTIHSNEEQVHLISSKST